MQKWLQTNLNHSIFLNSFRSATNENTFFESRVGKSVARFAYFFFKNIALLAEGRVTALYWNWKNRFHFKEMAPFYFDSPVFPSQGCVFPPQFSDLAIVYMKLNEVKDENSFRKHLNKKLKQGMCHAECQYWIETVQANKTSLAQEILHFRSYPSRMIFLQTVEIFRDCFQRHNRAEDLQKLREFCPGKIVEEIFYELNQVNLQDCLKRDLENKNALVAVRLYDKFSSHTILIETNTQQRHFGFYNNEVGYFVYETFDEGISALMEHVASHTNYLKKEAEVFWELSFY